MNKPHDDAETDARAALATDRNDLAATNALALLLFARGNLAEAELHARNAIRIGPENPQAHNLMGMILTESNRPQTGEFHYRQVLDLTEARDPVLLANLAWNLKSQGRMDEARALYRESRAARPDIRQTLFGFARLEEADRRFDAAADILDEMEGRFPDDPNLKLTRAVLLGRMRRFDEAIALIDTMGERESGLGPTELLEKGRLLDQLGRYDDAWTAFEAGKRLARERSGKAYLDEEAGRESARLTRFFVAPRLNLLPRAAPRRDVPQPIFILGFPRSGTTLVEQTLSAHPAIAAGDELPLIHEITRIMPRMLASPLAYPQALAELWMGDHRDGLETLRDHYLQKVRQLGVLRPGATRFTDKMPLNETHLGLIALLFPEAPLLHVLRHPLDVMVSCMSNHFTHGFFCASALETAARHYVRVTDLVAHYRAEMSLRYLAIRYEEIVRHHTASVAAMLAFVGEAFDPACLTFHDNRRYARTASYAQVTEPLYDRSVERWRHYRRQLEPAMAILAPAIERLGYDVV
ncbi:tetratricopeptide repeat-containing sulfotransferase family protein [Acidisoma cladoniae]|uniref:tetratricopeptide repeat-containing sulfotransferase family protein n=1 Tax=Acidisoma cladoniae TaxID=3040935 RepID=UPI002550D9A5|nr:sulfotransferase family protein [Acidisoma sp. PAMC 29798]